MTIATNNLMPYLILHLYNLLVKLLASLNFRLARIKSMKAMEHLKRLGGVEGVEAAKVLAPS